MDLSICESNNPVPFFCEPQHQKDDELQSPQQYFMSICVITMEVLGGRRGVAILSSSACQKWYAIHLHVTIMLTIHQLALVAHPLRQDSSIVIFSDDELQEMMNSSLLCACGSTRNFLLFLLFTFAR
jgi:hypothetical protein